jgi:hypothetical protein
MRASIGTSEVCVVEDVHLALVVGESMKPTGILRDGPAPRDGQREEQCIQPRIIEPLTDVLAGGQDDPGRGGRDRRQPVHDGPPLLLAHARSEDNEVPDVRLEVAFEPVQMVVPFRQQQGRPPCANGLEHVLADAPIAGVVLDQLLVERLELHPLVGVGRPCRSE